MTGVLILAHGSKRQETEQTLNSLVEKLKEKTGQSLIYPAYLQFSEQNIEAGIDRLVLNGARDIKIIPLFLFDGIHITQDIPAELKEISMGYPGINIRIGKHLGDDDRIVDIVADRLSELE